MAGETGSLSAALGVAVSGGDGRVVEVTLRLRADSGNGAVVKQLTQQVNDAARKVYEDIEAVTQKLIAAANESAKSIGDAMSKACERMASDYEESSSKIEAGSKRVAEAHKQRAADAERDAKHQARIESSLTKQTEQGAIQSMDRVEEHRRKQEELLKRGLQQFGEVASHVSGLLEDLALATSTSKEAAEKLADSFEKFEHIFGIFERGLKVFTGINEALATMKELAAAAAAEQKLLAAATAAPGVAGAAKAGGMARAKGGGAVERNRLNERAVEARPTAAGVASEKNVIGGAGKKEAEKSPEGGVWRNILHDEVRSPGNWLSAFDIATETRYLKVEPWRKAARAAKGGEAAMRLLARWGVGEAEAAAPAARFLPRILGMIGHQRTYGGTRSAELGKICGHTRRRGAYGLRCGHGFSGDQTLCEGPGRRDGSTMAHYQTRRDEAGYWQRAPHGRTHQAAVWLGKLCHERTRTRNGDEQ